MADVYRDLVYTRNTSAIGATDTTITVEDVSLFPSSALVAKSDFWLTIESSLSYPNSFEIVKLTNVDNSTKTLTVVRGQAGTSGVAHSIATYIKGALTSDMLRRVRSGLYGTTLPLPDADIFSPGDRFYHLTEQRYYAFTGAAATMSDTFTRANSTTTMGSTETTVSGSVASPWVNTLGVFGITSNRATYQSGAVANRAAVLTNVGSADFDVSVTVNTATANGSFAGVFVRGSLDGLYGYYLGLAPASAFTLYRVVNGTYTSIATNSVVAANTSYLVRMKVVGSTITTWINGAQVAALGYTDATPPSLAGAGVGFMLSGAAALTDANIWWDNFSVASASTVAGGWQPVSDIPGGMATFQNGALVQMERIQSLQSQNIDDLQTAIANNESRDFVSQLIQNASVIQEDDMLDTLRVVDKAGQGVESTASQLAVQMDEMLAYLQASVTLTGVGPPSLLSPSLPNQMYLDVSTRAMYFWDGLTWTQLTTPNVGATATPTFLGAWSGTFVGSAAFIPTNLSATNVQYGDLLILAVTIGLSSAVFNLATNNPLPNDWVLQGTPVVAPGPFQTAIYAKRAGPTDVGTTLAYFSTGSSAQTTYTLRAYRNASLGVAAVSNSGSLSAPSVTTTSPGDIVAHFWCQTGTLGFNTAVTPTFDSSVVNTFTYLPGTSTAYAAHQSADEYVRTAGLSGSPKVSIGTLANGTIQFNHFSVDVRGFANTATSSTIYWRGPYVSTASYAAYEGVFYGGLYYSTCPLPVSAPAPGPGVTVTPPTSNSSGWTGSNNTYGLNQAPSYVSGTDVRFPNGLQNDGGAITYNSPLGVDGLRVQFQVQMSSTGTSQGGVLNLLDASQSGVGQPADPAGNTAPYRFATVAGLSLQIDQSANAVKLLYRATTGGSATTVANVSGVTIAATNWELQATRLPNGLYGITVLRAGAVIMSVSTAAPDVMWLQFGAGTSGGQVSMRNVVATASGPWVQVTDYANTLTWNAPTLLNSWTNTGGSNPPTGYFKDGDGFVNLRGMVQGGTANTVAFNLPVGFRPEFLTPAVGVAFTTGTPSGPVYITVGATGDVTIVTTGTTTTSLDGCRFRAYQ